ncbi:MULTISPECIES: SIMPL domain-containing protein [Cyanophyceae]|uniref:SIMPL domain-containing protein n=1 Tax=Cyanophyceae TaxID=3028117 RepID=UPI0016845515|nr:SIMPL domain-containing protein [Trichocoleus sp. FACHB-69]MBD1931326.1 SIMPL domain-containing protein [Trichocoleus sp. FACHB-69]
MNLTFASSFWKQAGLISLVLSVLSLSIATRAVAQEKMLRTLTVSGRGVENIPTTLTQVRLGVEVQGKVAADVQQEAARRSAAVVELLKSRNVEKLETTGISLNPIYSYENNVQRLTGYSATNIVSFRIDTQKAGTLLDEAVKAGATRIDGISFVADDSAIASAQKQALREATQDAQAQADAVLSSLNLTRREIVNIQVNGAVVPPPRPIPIADMAMRSETLAKTTPVIGGEQEVEASVTLQISY